VTPGELLARVRALARAESLGALDAALAWGLPKCRTEEERLLYPALLLVLGNLNALVVPRRLDPGDLADFHLTVSCPGPDGAPRRVHLLLHVACDAPPADPAAGELWLPAADVRAAPLACAARALEALLRSASVEKGSDGERSGI
jgi:hypothetical protein